MKFTPVSTLADLDSLNQDEVVEGYRSAERGDPEPGENRGRSYWHGWRNRMMDYGIIPGDEASRQLANEFVQSQRAPWHRPTVRDEPWPDGEYDCDGNWKNPVSKIAQH